MDISNSTVLGRLLLWYDWDLSRSDAQALSVEGLTRARARVEALAGRLDSTQMRAADRETVRQEVRHAAAMLRHACELGAARLGAEDRKTLSIPQDQRARLATDLEKLIESHKTVWLLRNRPGGLEDSLVPMKQLLDGYRQ